MALSSPRSHGQGFVYVCVYYTQIHTYVCLSCLQEMLNFIRNYRKKTCQGFLEIGKTRNIRFPTSLSSSSCWKEITALGLKTTQKPKWSRQNLLSLPIFLLTLVKYIWQRNFYANHINTGNGITLPLALVTANQWGKNVSCKHSKSQHVLRFYSSFALIEVEDMKDVLWIKVWVSSVNKNGELATEAKSTYC